MTNLRLAAVLASVLAASTAQAGTAHSWGTMCGFYDSSYCGKTKAPTPQGFDPNAGAAWDDNLAETYRQSPVTTERHQLLIFLHGTGGSAAGLDGNTATGQFGFYDAAVSNGYRVIAPDWPDSDKSNGTVCGCFRDCYGDWDWIRWMGGSKDGLRTITSAESITGRVRAILHNRMAADPAGNWGQFLDAAQDGGLAWQKIVVSGHSQGGNLAFYITKHEPLAKAILFSAPDEELSSTHGSSHTDLTVYHYGTENGIGACTPTAHTHANECDQLTDSLLVAGYTADNDFQNFGGSTWLTPLDRIYSFNDTLDTAAPWATSHAGLCTIKLDTQNTGTADFLDVSSANTSSPTWNSGDYHWLVSSFNKTSTSQCGNIDTGGVPFGGHTQVISTSHCKLGSVGEAKRWAVWQYMLGD